MFGTGSSGLGEIVYNPRTFGNEQTGSHNRQDVTLEIRLRTYAARLCFLVQS
jgi:hypothetical protein